MSEPATATQADLTVIERKKGLRLLPVRELLGARDLLYFLVYRDFVAKYKQTLLGPLWFLLQPLMMTIVFTVIFGNFANIPTDELPGPLFYLCGLLAWNVFSQAFQTSSNVLLSNKDLFTKVYFPRLIVPIANIGSHLMAFAIQLILFACFWFYFNTFTEAGALLHLRWEMLLLPLVLLQLLVTALGCGLIMSAITARYRDLHHMSAFIIQVWMYASAVIYPLSLLPPNYRLLALLNPVVAPIEGFRLLLLGQASILPVEWAFSAVLSFGLMFLGLILFCRMERTFVDYA
jgi:lipopolysaccharide transport system permease protein